MIVIIMFGCNDEKSKLFLLNNDSNKTWYCIKKMLGSSDYTDANIMKTRIIFSKDKATWIENEQLSDIRKISGEKPKLVETMTCNDFSTIKADTIIFNNISTNNQLKFKIISLNENELVLSLVGVWSDIEFTFSTIEGKFEDHVFTQKDIERKEKVKQDSINLVTKAKQSTH